MRRALACGLALAALAFGGMGLAAASFSDPAGDDNAAPDITSVSLSEAADGVLNVRVAVANFQTLPSSSWFNVWFDLDGDETTGDDAGDDALVRYTAGGTIESYAWDGQAMAPLPTAGTTGSFDAGVLSLAIPMGGLGTLGAPRVLVVSARSQQAASGSFVASDFAPDSGRSSWSGVGPTLVPDAADDHDAAPDITSVRVSDTKTGWITFAITTPNRAVLPGKSVVIVSIDSDANAGTGSDGVDVDIVDFGGQVRVERWSAAARRWVPDPRPTLARARSGQNVVTIEIHRSELGDSPRFRFGLVSADFNAVTGEVLGVDFAPELGPLWLYRLVNAPSVRLVAGKAFGAPVTPRAGKPFRISTPVTRSDTNRAIASGSVACNVRAAGKRVPATGQVRGGHGHCSLVVPVGALTLTGSMTVRSAGKAVTARFAFRVR